MNTLICAVRNHNKQNISKLFSKVSRNYCTKENKFKEMINHMGNIKYQNTQIQCINELSLTGTTTYDFKIIQYSYETRNEINRLCRLLEDFSNSMNEDIPLTEIEKLRTLICAFFEIQNHIRYVLNVTNNLERNARDETMYKIFNIVCTSLKFEQNMLHISLHKLIQKYPKHVFEGSIYELSSLSN